MTESHRPSLVDRLEADGVDVAATIQQGSYVPMDAEAAMEALTLNGTPDPDRCAKVVGEAVTRAAKGVRGERARVTACGDWSRSRYRREGTADEAAIKPIRAPVMNWEYPPATINGRPCLGFLHVNVE